jgi:murein L,D-transpeptidase YafK
MPRAILKLLLCIGISYSSQSSAIASSACASPAINEKIDSIVIVKSTRQMAVFHQGRLLKSYRVCLGPNPIGPKHFRGDGKTPEGLYYIDGKNPNSHYHKALAVSYPNATDMQYARQQGQPAGGDIKIHGLPNGFGKECQGDVKDDWTLGCIALTDDAIDECMHIPQSALL